MENQHRKITGYRDLSQAEIDLMNRIKAAGQVLLDLQAEVSAKLGQDREVLIRAADAAEFIVKGERKVSGPYLELARFNAAEPFRWAAIAKTDVQTGVMALVRAVAQPTDC